MVNNALFVVLLASSSMLLNNVVLVEATAGGNAVRELGMAKELIERHAVPPPDYDADFDFPQTNVATLLKTPCHPEGDGFFGSTSGQPIGLRYGFQMETAIHGDVTAALEAIDELVVDSVLSSVFPGVCGDQRRLQTKAEEGRATGFRFRQEQVDMTKSCLPTSTAINYCAVYTGTILMYGHKLEEYNTGEVVLGYVREAIDTSLAEVLNYGVVRLEIDEDITRPLVSSGGGRVPASKNDGSESQDDGFSSGAVVGLTLSTLALIATVVGFLAYLRMDKKAGQITKRSRSVRFRANNSSPSFLDRFRSNDLAGTDSEGSTSQHDEHEQADLQMPGNGGRSIANLYSDDTTQHIDDESDANSHSTFDHSMSDYIARNYSTAESTALPDDEVYLDAIVD